jgi:hypothetical protein
MRDEQMRKERAGRSTLPGSAVPDGQAELDVRLTELARSCNLAEPKATLRQRVLDRAAEEGLVGAAVQVGERTQRLEAKRPVPWRRRVTRPHSVQWRAAMAIAASLVLGVALWQPWRTVLERPLAGVASIEVPEQAWVRTQRYAHLLSPEPSIVREPAAVNTEIAGAANTAEPEGPERVAVEDRIPSPKPPPLQWPPEVLVAAQRYAASRDGVGDADWPVAEVPLRSVRVQMAADDLWRMGLAATPGPSDRRITADFLVQENGRPLAVRLVGMDQ